MTSPAGALNELAEVVAQLLSNAGDLSPYRPSGDYDEHDVAIAHGRPGQFPQQGVWLVPYVVRHEALTQESVLAVNLHHRGDEDVRTVIARSTAAFDVLHGLQDLSTATLNVALMWQQNSNPGGVDDRDRCHWQDSYYARVTWPATHRDHI